MHRLAAGLAVPLLLVTAACGGDSTPQADEPAEGTLADVTVTGEQGEQPTVDFKAPLSFNETESKVVEEGPGDGDAAKSVSTVTIDYVLINASDSVEVDSSWETGKPATFALNQVFPALSTGLEGAHAGDRVLVTVASEDGFGDNGNGTTIRAGDSLVVVADVTKVSNPAPIPREQLPTLEEDADGLPQKFTAKPATPSDVGLLGVYVVTKGKGPKVEAGQTLTVEYLGQVWPDGAVFDESFSAKEPVSLSLDQVIPGWQQGLVGQTVGSRVILTIPSDLAYGAAGSGETIPPNTDLIFVIDIEKAA